MMCDATNATKARQRKIDSYKINHSGGSARDRPSRNHDFMQENGWIMVDPVHRSTRITPPCTDASDTGRKWLLFGHGHGVAQSHGILLPLLGCSPIQLCVPGLTPWPHPHICPTKASKAPASKETSPNFFLKASSDGNVVQVISRLKHLTLSYGPM